MRKFKDKKCKTLFGKILQYVLFNHYTQLAILIFTLLVSGILVGNLDDSTKLFNICYNIFIGSSIGLGIFAVIGFLFAWIINPIKNRKKNKS